MKKAKEKNKLKNVVFFVIITALLFSSVIINGDICMKTKAEKSKFNIGEKVSPMGKMAWSKNHGINGIFEYNSPKLLKNTESVARLKGGNLSYYNLAEKNLSTSVKDQGDYGTCWAHSAIASMESNMIMKKASDENIDLSERHLAWYAYECIEDKEKDPSRYAGTDSRDYIGESNVYNKGGLRDTAIVTLARKYGAVNEVDCPYNKEKYKMQGADEADGAPRTMSKVSMTDALYLPETCRNDLTGNKKEFKGYMKESIKDIKDAIVRKGAVSTSYHAFDSSNDDNGPFFNDKYNAYYCWDGSLFANHAVTIVGWDDDFSYEKFNDGNNNLPQNSGAWIVKNSWGTKYGDEGYFYISYYDKSLKGFTSYEAAYPEKNIKNSYQYDGIGMGDVPFESDVPVEGSNCYIARDNESMVGIGTYTPVADCNIELTVYNAPRGNEILHRQTYHVKQGGFHTLKINKKISFKKNQTFMVGIKTSFKKDGKKKYFLPFEEKEKSVPFGWSVVLDVRKNQSFIKMQGLNHGNWCDMKDVDNLEDNAIHGNALIKVYNGKYTGVSQNSLKGKLPVPVIKCTALNRNNVSVTINKIKNVSGYEIFFGGKKVKTIGNFSAKSRNFRISSKKIGIGKIKGRVFVKKKGKTYYGEFSSLQKPMTNVRNFKKKNFWKIKRGRVIFSITQIKLTGATYTIKGYIMNRKSRKVRYMRRLKIKICDRGKAVIARKIIRKLKVNVRGNGQRKIVLKIKGKAFQDLRYGRLFI